MQAAVFCAVGSGEGQMTMRQFEMTKCNKCGSEMRMGTDICPCCGQPQSRSARSGNIYQPGTLLAVGLAAAVLLFFNWINPRTPHASQITSPPSVTVPAR
jgi:ribosomal protein L37E